MLLILIALLAASMPDPLNRAAQTGTRPTVAAVADGGRATSCAPGEDRPECEEGKAKSDYPREAAEQRLQQQQNEKGAIPANALVKASQHALGMKHRPMPGAVVKSSQTSTSPSGVAGIGSGLWTPLGPGNIGGRIRALVIDPTNASVMYAGSVGGGVWKTTNGGVSWQALDDFMANLAVSTLVMDPTDHNVLYAGTGEGMYNGDAIRGAGIFKTTDAGATWSQIPSTANGSWYYVNRIAISPANNQVMLAATNTGVYRTTDGGGSWALVNTDPYVKQVAFDPNNSNNAVAAGDTLHAYYSSDNGATWTAATGLPAAPAWYYRVEVAYAPSAPNTVYASVDFNNGLVYKSTDGGHSYTQVGSNSYGYLAIPGYSSQGWYDNAVWVDPTNANTVVVGGIDLWRSTDGANTFTRISDWRCGGIAKDLYPYSCTGGISAHADHHGIVAAPGYNGSTNKTVFFANDGGVYKAADVSTVSLYSGWQELNNNLSITQFYGGAGNSTSGTVVGGAQDNGSLTFTGNSEGWVAMYGGDGGFSAADPTDPNYVYGEYVYLAIHRSTTGGTLASSHDIYNGITDATTGAAYFIAPFILDPNNPNTMLGGGQSLWRSTNVKSSVPSWSSIKPGIGTAYNQNISAVAVAPGNSNIIWVGHGNGNIYRTTNGTAATPTWTQIDALSSPPLPDRYVARITIDPNNANVVYATFGGFSPDNVYRTTDGGTTWTDITGSGTTALPDAPVRSLVIHPNNSNWLYVGTEVGIFASEDGGATWSVPTDGPANVSVDELFWMGTKLVAVTHGRGMFSAETVNPVPTATSISPASTTAGSPAFTLTVTGTNFVAGSTVRWNGADRATTYVSSTQLTASIPSSDVAATGSVPVTVFNPLPGGGTSNALTFTVGPSDTTAPSVVTAPTHSYAVNDILGIYAIPVRMFWLASDNVGVYRYELQRSQDGGAYFNISLPNRLTNSIRFGMGYAHTFRFRVRAFDAAGNVSGWSYGPAFYLAATAEDNPAIAYAGQWTRTALSGSFGGYVKYSSTLGNSAAYTLRAGATQVAWTSTRGTNRGAAKVEVLDPANHVVRSAVVDLYKSGTIQFKPIVFEAHGLDPAVRYRVRVTVIEKNAASVGRRVDIDGFSEYAQP